MDENPEPTISLEEVVVRACPHCDASTVQVEGGSGIPADDDEKPTRACLQCIADGGTCCSLAPLDRRRP